MNRLLFLLLLAFSVSAQTVKPNDHPSVNGKSEGIAPQSPLVAYPSDKILLVDGDKYTSCQAAISAIGSSGIVIIPYGFAGKCTYAIPSGVEVWDLRSGGLGLFSTAEGNAGGQTPGVNVIIGPSGWCSNMPGTNNLVGYSSCVVSQNGVSVWGANPSAALLTNAPDAGIVGVEMDMEINPGGSHPRTDPYLGYTAVNVGPVPATTAFQSSAVSGAGTWTNGFECNANGTVFCFAVNGGSSGPNTDGSYTITQSITGSKGNQRVTTNAKTNPINLQFGSFISVDTGANQEDVYVTNITGTSVSGVFAKNHSNGTHFFAYTSEYFWSAEHSVSKAVPYYLGNLRQFNTYHASNPLGWSAGDASGTPRVIDFYSASGKRHFADLGDGWEWDDESIAKLASLNKAGLFQATSFALKDMVSSSTEPVVSSGFGSATAIGAANGTASFTINVGVDPRRSSVTLTMPSAKNGWNCMASDKTTPGTNLVRQSNDSNTSVTLTDYDTAGTASVPNGRDVIGVLCGAY
jgi:hypothetical protein